mgnify:CR=1 FL=1|jgi:hypothetical protein
MTPTIQLLRAAARTTPRSTLPAAAAEIAHRRGVDVVTCQRFVALDHRLDTSERLPTATELATLGALAREIEAR